MIEHYDISNDHHIRDEIKKVRNFFFLIIFIEVLILLNAIQHKNIIIFKLKLKSKIDWYLLLINSKLYLHYFNKLYFMYLFILYITQYYQIVYV